MTVGQHSKISLRMQQSKNLQVSLLSAGKNKSKNCNLSAIHKDESHGDDSNWTVDKVSLMKNPAQRRVAALKLVLAEFKTPTYKSGLSRVSVAEEKKVDQQRNYFHYFVFCSWNQQLALSFLTAPFCPHAFLLLTHNYDLNTLPLSFWVTNGHLGQYICFFCSFEYLWVSVFFHFLVPL